MRDERRAALLARIAGFAVDHQEDGEVERKARIGCDMDGENVAPLHRELVDQPLRKPGRPAWLADRSGGSAAAVRLLGAASSPGRDLGVIAGVEPRPALLVEQEEGADARLQILVE